MKKDLVMGDWNARCDQCGRLYKASQLKERWDGKMVCKEDYETRHPQEFVRAVPDTGKVPWTRPNTDIDPATGAPVSSVAPTYISTSVGTQPAPIPSGTFDGSL